MNTNNPLKENVICVLNPDGIKYVDTFESSNVPVTQLVTPQQAYELQEQGLFRDPIRENTIYIFHPLYNQFIIRTKEDDDKLIQRRINAIETIVSYLGGKNFNILSTHAFRKDKGIGIKADEKVHVRQDITKVDVNNDFSLKKSDSSERDMEVHSGAEWEGKYSVEGFNKALRIVKENGLQNDPDICFLLEQRSPEHPNPIQRKDYHVQLHSELSQYLQVADQLKTKVNNVMTSVNVEINVNVEKSTEEETSETFDFSVEFGPVVPVPEPIIIEPSLENKKTSININAILIGIITVLLIAVVVLFILFL